MRFKALILLLCTLGYLVEWTATPRMLAAPAPKICCASASEKCCAEMPTRPCTGVPKEKGHEQYPRPDKGCNQMGDCCLNCPLCYLTVLPASVGEQPIAPVLSRVYPVYTDTYAYNYHTSAWKPPNRS